MVNTHRELEHDLGFEQHICEVCGRAAHYWSQNEGADGERLGRVVWHCQRHRQEARGIASTE